MGTEINISFRKTFFISLLLAWVAGCQSGRDPTAGQLGKGTLDGFEHRSYESIAAKLKKSEDRKKSLILEGEWLKLRAQVVDAEKYACECQLSELSLALEMARFGSFDQRLPRTGFINDEERTRWNAQLEVKRANRITAEARASLLRRDLHDLSKSIEKEGYSIPAGLVIE